MRSNWLLSALLLSSLTLVGCAARRPVLHEPVPCTDSLYLQLKRVHPDSLSERAWQRLQSLQADCVSARAQPEHGRTGMMGMGSRRGLLGMGILMVGAAGMLVMMSLLR